MTAKPTSGRAMTMPDIRREGFQALLDRLGPAGAVRFLQMYDPGRGDYTRERHQWLDDLSLDEILRSIQQRQEPTAEPEPPRV